MVCPLERCRGRHRVCSHNCGHNSIPLLLMLALPGPHLGNVHRSGCLSALDETILPGTEQAPGDTILM